MEENNEQLSIQYVALHYNEILRFLYKQFIDIYNITCFFILELLEGGQRVTKFYSKMCIQFSVTDLFWVLMNTEYNVALFL